MPAGPLHPSLVTALGQSHGMVALLRVVVRVLGLSPRIDTVACESARTHVTKQPGKWTTSVLRWVKVARTRSRVPVASSTPLWK